MDNLYRIVRHPILTEKTTHQKEALNKVTFKVDPGATKREIKEAVQSIFNVTVLDVHTSNMLGKNRRWRMRRGKRPDWKKAVVTLKPGDKVEFFEGL
ncbi:MAG: 50S ribosomal protein L23 [Nitrospinota bacterium]